ncbi:MAG: DUF1016 domain-containing protein [Leptolyngbyaceae cyanobacterium SL_5_9]|nr:DUF1016 domain-containing protein [Leptolyngbyaceae cyanobacterium SL_5_9]
MINMRRDRAAQAVNSEPVMLLHWQISGNVTNTIN